MTQSFASLQTEKASQYLQTLCKHFGRKIPTEFDTLVGEINFPFGTCKLRATDKALELSVRATRLKDLVKLERIVGNHVERFAFRETPEINWTAQTNN